MRILQVSTADSGSGAERAAANLLEIYRARGFEAWLAVGHRYGAQHPAILDIPNRRCRGPWSRGWYEVRDALLNAKRRTGFRGLGRAAFAAEWLADLDKWRDRKRGREDFHFPGTRRLLSLPPVRPDILHCHNLHGSYFDLRLLPELSQHIPTVLTLHDMWLFTGHCAYSVGCPRWRAGCGECPDLELYPRLERDSTAFNWRRKREIYADGRFYVTTPSRWLMNQVEQSILAPSIREAKVIPNGVDLGRFRPGGRAAARALLGLEIDSHIVLFSGSNLRRNRFKDYATVLAALARSQAKADRRLIFIALGDDAADPKDPSHRHWEIRGVPFETDPARVAAYHQAADLYLHAAIDDNFPYTVLESLACGTPVLATAVGGISEQVRGLKADNALLPLINQFPPEEATGRLVPARDPVALAGALDELIGRRDLLSQMGENAARDARLRFDRERQGTATLQWYEEILAQQQEARPGKSYFTRA